MFAMLKRSDMIQMMVQTMRFALFTIVLCELAVKTNGLNDSSINVQNLELMTHDLNERKPSWMMTNAHLSGVGHSGIPSIQARRDLIVGGYKVAASSRPYMVGLLIQSAMNPTEQGSKTVCGGVYIGSKESFHFILTAGHCIESNQTSISAFFKTNQLTKFNSAPRGHFLNELYRKYIHAGFNIHNYTNDIGLLIFKQNNFSSPAPAVLGSSETHLRGGEVATMAGYGYTSSLQTSSDDVLRQVKLRIMSSNKCLSFFSKTKVALDPESELCTIKDTKGPCRGDSGGPLLIKRNGSEVVVGLVSWTYGCPDRIHFPSVYSRVSAHEKWIRSIVNSTVGRSDFLRFHEKPTTFDSGTIDSEDLIFMKSDEFASMAVDYIPYLWTSSGELGSSSRVNVGLALFFIVIHIRVQYG